jgi:hypothetical protein
MTILVTGLIAGALDAVAAVLFFLARGNKQPGALFRYIASAVYGKAAFTGGAGMIAMGILFHFAIAFFWVGCYFALYPLIAGLNTGIIIDAVVYGLVVWAMMNLVVVPLSRAARRPASLSFILINMLILMIAIGMPCVYGARHAG